MEIEFNHKPVMLNEVLSGLNINPDGIYIDCTLGGGGHSEEILKKLSPNGMLIGLDKDEIEVFLAINGVGRDKVTNYRVLARQLGKREYEIRRIKQHAEEKVRRLTS